MFEKSRLKLFAVNNDCQETLNLKLKNMELYKITSRLQNKPKKIIVWQLVDMIFCKFEGFYIL